MIGVVWLSRAGRPTAEFAIGTAIVFCVGQLGYTAVPGYGPIKYLEGSFQASRTGGRMPAPFHSAAQLSGEV